MTNKDAEMLLQEANRLGVNLTDLLRLMDREVVPSTQEERQEQSRRRMDAEDEFLKRNPNASPSQIWSAGFRTGWTQYQSRKESLEKAASEAK